MPAPVHQPTTATFAETSNCRSPRRLKLHATRNASCRRSQYGHECFIPWTSRCLVLDGYSANRTKVEVSCQDQDVETSSHKYLYVTAPPEQHDYERLLPHRQPDVRASAMDNTPQKYGIFATQQKNSRKKCKNKEKRGCTLPKMARPSANWRWREHAERRH